MKGISRMKRRKKESQSTHGGLTPIAFAWSLVCPILLSLLSELHRLCIGDSTLDDDPRRASTARTFLRTAEPNVPAKDLAFPAFRLK